MSVIGSDLYVVPLRLWVGESQGSDDSLARRSPAVPLWFIGAAINMWIGVSRAADSRGRGAHFVVVFAVPATIALPRPLAARALRRVPATSLSALCFDD